VEELRAGGKVVEALVEPDEDIVPDPGRVLDLAAGRTGLRKRLPDLVHRGWDSEPDEHAENPEDGDEEERDRERLRDSPPPEPLDSRAHRGGEGQRQQQEDDQVSHLPEPECDRDHGDDRYGGSGRGTHGVPGERRSCRTAFLPRPVDRHGCLLPCSR
jgi:hypothetical protein